MNYKTLSKIAPIILSFATLAPTQTYAWNPFKNDTQETKYSGMSIEQLRQLKKEKTQQESKKKQTSQATIQTEKQETKTERLRTELNEPVENSTKEKTTKKSELKQIQKKPSQPQVTPRQNNCDPDCEKRKITLEFPKDQFIGPITIDRHLAKDYKEQLFIEGYDRHALENNKATIDTFCGENDYVVLKLPEMTPRQKALGMTLAFDTSYNTALEQNILADNKITREELASLPKDKNGYHVLKTKNAMKLLDKEGKQCASYELHYNAVYNEDCKQTSESKIKKNNHTSGRKKQTGANTTGDGDIVRYTTRSKEGYHFGITDETKTQMRTQSLPWSITVGAGTFSNTLENKLANNDCEVKPCELEHLDQTFSGTKFHIKLEYTTPKTLFSLAGATAQGTDKGQNNNGYGWLYNTSIKGTSLAAQYQQAFTRWTIKPLVGVAAEHKVVTVDDNYADLKNTNTTLAADAGVLIGDLDHNNVKATVGYARQDVDLQQYAASSNSSERGTSTTETTIKYELSGRVFVADDNFELFGNVKHMMPQTQQTTDERERIEKSTVTNYRFGVNWWLGQRFALGVEYQGATERF